MIPRLQPQAFFNNLVLMTILSQGWLNEPTPKGVALSAPTGGFTQGFSKPLRILSATACDGQALNQKAYTRKCVDRRGPTPRSPREYANNLFSVPTMTRSNDLSRSYPKGAVSQRRVDGFGAEGGVSAKRLKRLVDTA